jgi:hypothetical protein
MTTNVFLSIDSNENILIHTGYNINTNKLDYQAVTKYNKIKKYYYIEIINMNKIILVSNCFLILCFCCFI